MSDDFKIPDGVYTGNWHHNDVAVTVRNRQVFRKWHEQSVGICLCRVTIRDGVIVSVIDDTESILYENWRRIGAVENRTV